MLFLVRDAQRGKVLYDTLEMTPPPVDVRWSQRTLDADLGPILLKRAIVVPNSRLAYLARQAFGEATIACSTTTLLPRTTGSVQNRSRPHLTRVR